MNRGLRFLKTVGKDILGTVIVFAFFALIMMAGWGIFHCIGEAAIWCWEPFGELTQDNGEPAPPAIIAFFLLCLVGFLSIPFFFLYGMYKWLIESWKESK